MILWTRDGLTTAGLRVSLSVLVILIFALSCLGVAQQLEAGNRWGVIGFTLVAWVAGALMYRWAHR